MEKRIVEKLLEKSNGPKRGRPMFIAHLNEIQECLDRGFPKKDIWKSLKEEGKLSFGYNQFLDYTNELCVVMKKKTPKKKTPEVKTVDAESNEGPRIASGHTQEDLQQKLIVGSQKKREDW